MAKSGTGTDGKQHGPDDIVRYSAWAKRAERAKFKYFCERSGLKMEEVGWRWIMERLATEEKKLSR